MKLLKIRMNTLLTCCIGYYVPNVFAVTCAFNKTSIYNSDKL